MSSITGKKDPVVSVTFNHTNVDPVDGQPRSIRKRRTRPNRRDGQTWLDTPLATVALVHQCLPEL
ncbi:hypothetical protein Q0F98_00745 [Paenibacillus amylolyticus]|nr:hypothetical protein Q0F98_00745 [Paenibacillus amylolyticus]